MPNIASTAGGSRLNFLDDLRFTAIALVVVFHASLGYMAGSPRWWYMHGASANRAAAIFVICADVFMMPLLFFISGYLGARSLAGRAPAAFLRRRLPRLALPWLAGVALAAPALAYRTALNYGYKAGFIEFLMHGFPGVYYSQGPYWFLGLLLALDIAAAAVRGVVSRCHYTPARTAAFSFVLLLSAAGMAAAVGSADPDSWSSLGKVLFFQPARIAGYAAFYMLGSYALAAGWFEEGGYRPAALPWGLAASCALICWVIVKVAYHSAQGHVPAAVYALAHSVFCLTAVMALLAAGAARAAKRLPVTISSASFAIYLFHLPLMLAAFLIMHPYAMGPAGEWAVLCAAGIILPVCLRGLLLRMKEPRF